MLAPSGILDAGFGDDELLEMTTHSTQSRYGWRAVAPAAPWIAAAGLLAAFGALAWKTAVETGPTFDEPAHLADGYVALKTGGFALNPEHPPLAKLWAALPLLSSNDIPPLQDALNPNLHSAWGIAIKLFFSSGPEAANRVMAAARRQMLVFALALGVVIFLWSRELWGTWAGVFSLALFAFCPNFIAHGSLVCTDVPATLGFTLAAWLAWRLRRSGRWGGTVLVGLALAFLLCVKFSGVLAIPPLVAWLAFIPAPPRRSDQSETAQAAGQSPAPNAASESEPPPIVRFPSEREIPWRVGRVALILVIAAAGCVAIYGWPPQWFAYVDGLNSVYKNHSPNYAFYFWGHRSAQRSLLYFPAAMLLKTPLPTLAALAGAFACLRRWNWNRALVTLAPAVYLLAVAMAMAVDIGVRYVFPAYAPLFVFAGVCISADLPRPRLRAGLAAALVACLAWVGARSAPNGISFFNSIAGGAKGGIRYLDDSNLDWGQAIPQALRYIHDHPNEKIIVGWYSPVTPQHYGASCESFFQNPDHLLIPAQATYILSANVLTHSKASGASDFQCDWLDQYRPAKILGGSMWVFKFAYAGQQEPRFDAAAGVNWIDEEATLRSGIARLREEAQRSGKRDWLKLSAAGTIRLGALLTRQKRYSEAFEAFESARRDGYSQDAAAASLALLYCSMGRLPEARRELHNLRQLAPNHPNIPAIEAEIKRLASKAEPKTQQPASSPPSSTP